RLHASVLEAFKSRPRILVEFPPLRAMVAGRIWTVERALAQTAIEADEGAARLRAPRHTIGIDVTAAHPDARFGHCEELRQLCLRVKTHEAGLATEDADGVPDRAVLRIRHDCVGAGTAGNACVLAGVGRLAGLDVVIPLALAVGVDNEGCPPDSFLRVVCFIPHFCVDPACYRAGAGQPQSIVGVIAELWMMRAEASVDEVILHRLWIDHCDLTGTLVDRENLGVWVTGTLLAPVRVIHPAHGRRQPDPALRVE